MEGLSLGESLAKKFKAHHENTEELKQEAELKAIPKDLPWQTPDQLEEACVFMENELLTHQTLNPASGTLNFSVFSHRFPGGSDDLYYMWSGGFGKHAKDVVAKATLIPLKETFLKRNPEFQECDTLNIPIDTIGMYADIDFAYFRFSWRQK